MATIKRNGFGQVEPNRLSMQRTGQMHAQQPYAGTADTLENGQFLKFNSADATHPLGSCKETGIGEWYMVFNEVKLYGDTYNETYKDYAMQKKNFIGGEMVPRLVKINIGDMYTTNCVGAANTYRNDYAGIDLAVGDTVKVDTTGYLVAGTDDDFELTVVKVYTMADGQPAVKLMRTK